MRINGGTARAGVGRAGNEDMKVLVIEDEPEIRTIFVKFLELMGYEADVAAT